MSRIKTILLRDIIPILVSALIFTFIYLNYGLAAGIYASLAFNVLVLLFTWFTKEKFVKLHLSDTALLCLLGAVSILTDNTLFIKLKSVLIELLLISIFWFSTYRRKNYFLELSSRYIRGMRILKNAPVKKGKMLTLLTIIMFIHAIGVLYAAMYMKPEEWAFISTLILYLILIIFITVGYIIDSREFKRLAGKEILPVVDENAMVTGRKPRNEFHFNQAGKFLHPVVHMHVLNSKGELYLQKRADDRIIQPGKWDTAVGGHISWGESVEECLRRESFEEIGLTGFTPVFTANYIWETKAEKELVFLFTTVTNSQPLFNPEELSEGKFWEPTEIKRNIGKGIFTPNLEHELEKFISHLQ